MSMIASPNWFSILSATFLFCGLCLAAKAALSDPATRDEASRRKASAERKVDLSIALPLLVLGGAANLLSTAFTLSANPASASIMLALAFAALLYLGYFDLMVDRELAEQGTVSPRAPKLAVVNPVAPQLPQPEALPEPRVLAAPKEAAAQL